MVLVSGAGQVLPRSPRPLWVQQLGERPTQHGNEPADPGLVLIGTKPGRDQGALCWLHCGPSLHLPQLLLICTGQSWYQIFPCTSQSISVEPCMQSTGSYLLY